MFHSKSLVKRISWQIKNQNHEIGKICCYRLVVTAMQGAAPNTDSSNRRLFEEALVDYILVNCCASFQG
jgi:hypothetical protein